MSRITRWTPSPQKPEMIMKSRVDALDARLIEVVIETGKPVKEDEPKEAKPKK